MEKASVVDVLRALASGEKDRSETARLRDVFTDVEAALKAGVSRAAVLEALHGQGFTMSLKSFESALYRIRRQRATATAEIPAGTQTAPSEISNSVTASPHEAAMTGGKLKSEKVLEAPNKSFSFKKLQQQKD